MRGAFCSDAGIARFPRTRLHAGIAPRNALQGRPRVGCVSCARAASWWHMNESVAFGGGFDSSGSILLHGILHDLRFCCSVHVLRPHIRLKRPPKATLWCTRWRRDPSLIADGALGSAIDGFEASQERPAALCEQAGLMRVYASRSASAMPRHHTCRPQSRRRYPGCGPPRCGSCPDGRRSASRTRCRS